MRDQSGFSVIEVLLVVLVVAVLAVTSVVVYQRHNRVNRTGGHMHKSTTGTQPAQPLDAYPGWKSAVLTDERLGFRYPPDWTLATAGDISNVFPKSTENIEVKSPVVNGHYFGVSLQAGPGDTTLNLNMLGNASGTTIAKLNVPGSAQPLYLDAETPSDQNSVACLGLATTPGSQNHDTAFGILDDNGKGQHNIVMYACLTPVTPTLADNGAEYSMQEYTSNKYYQTVIQIFQSLHYN